jgi:phosphoribosylamine--glycine ligase
MLAGNAFGEAGHRVVIEEFLDGEEASFIVMADGTNVLPMATSQDHKRVGVGDTGPNTGGMGAYSPAPVVDEVIYQRVMDEVIYPTVKGMAEEGNSYTGFLYAGLMIMADGTPKVIEYNCRFGDPETQPIMLRMQSDLVEHCLAAIDGTLNTQETRWNQKPSVGVVLAAGGYPNSYNKGDVIAGLPKLDSNSASADVSEKVFHAGTTEIDGNVCTHGGRVLCVTALGDNVSDAQAQAYKLASKINWNGMFYRDDIAWRAIEREQNS